MKRVITVIIRVCRTWKTGTSRKYELEMGSQSLRVGVDGVEETLGNSVGVYMWVLACNTSGGYHVEG